METNVQLRNVTSHTHKRKTSMDTNLLAKKHYIAKSQGIFHVIFFEGKDLSSHWVILPFSRGCAKA